MTYRYRPDLLAKAQLSEQDRMFLKTMHKRSFAKNIHIALVHHPVLLKNNTAGTSSVTNLDIHDISRIACTYGISSLQIVTPVQDQKVLVEELITHWTQGDGAKNKPGQGESLGACAPCRQFGRSMPKCRTYFRHKTYFNRHKRQSRKRQKRA